MKKLDPSQNGSPGERRFFFVKKEPDGIARKLIPKKFLTHQVLWLVTLISLVSLYLLSPWFLNLPLFVIVVIALPLIFFIVHTVYQGVCDIKLLFQSNNYDINIDSTSGEHYPTITFIIPSYQEPFSVAKMTFDSVVNVPYRGAKEIIVVDNSTDVFSGDFVQWKSYVEGFNASAGFQNITAKFFWNKNKKTLKPGNLDTAQQHIREGEFVVFLDVDSTLPLTEELLERSVAEFDADSTLGFIQFRIRATNKHFNELTQAVAISQDLLRVRMINRGYGGYKIFEGHNGIWRKSVLDIIGPWTEYYDGNIIITEDILKSTQVYAKGFYGKPLNVETGEWVPSSLKALEGMWMRWMYGNSQVFSKNVKCIYHKGITFVEKWDITYHILHHYVTACFFLVSFSLQLLVPGQAANIFMLSFGIIPQVIAGVASYATSVRYERTSIWKKIQYLYTAFFLVDTFITFIRLKSNIKFLLRVPQGWKVTEKGVESVASWKNLVLNNVFHIAMIIVSLGLCAVSWIVNDGMSVRALSYYSGQVFINMNLLLCLIYFAKQGRKPYNKVESAVIDSDQVEKKVFNEKPIAVEVV